MGELKNVFTLIYFKLLFSHFLCLNYPSNNRRLQLICFSSIIGFSEIIWIIWLHIVWYKQNSNSCLHLIIIIIIIIIITTMPVFIRQNLGKVHILLAIGYISLFPKSIYQIYRKKTLIFFPNKSNLQKILSLPAALT